VWPARRDHRARCLLPPPGWHLRARKRCTAREAAVCAHVCVGKQGVCLTPMPRSRTLYAAGAVCSDQHAGRAGRMLREEQQQLRDAQERLPVLSTRLHWQRRGKALHQPAQHVIRFLLLLGAQGSCIQPLLVSLLFVCAPRRQRRRMPAAGAQCRWRSRRHAVRCRVRCWRLRRLLYSCRRAVLCGCHLIHAAWPVSISCLGAPRTRARVRSHHQRCWQTRARRGRE
jgi:hypothetical protein